MAGVLFVVLMACISVGVMSDQEPVKVCPSFNETDVSVEKYNDLCYRFHLAEKTSFQYATNLCQSQGGRLLRPKTLEISGYLWFLIIRAKESKDNVWIGALKDRVSNKPEYFWQTGEEVPMETVESFLTYGVAYTVPRVEGIWRFDLGSKDATHPFVCEFDAQEVETTTTSAPTTTPTRKATSPTTTTTTTPTMTSTPIPTTPSLVDKLCPNLPGRHFFMKLFGQTCFYFQLSSLETYDQAKQSCKDNGGTLAIANTKLRDHFLRYHLNNSFRNKATVWIGLHAKDGSETTFTWEDGSPVTYSNFASDKPSGDTAMLFEVDDTWRMVPTVDKFKLNYICQFDAKVQNN